MAALISAIAKDRRCQNRNRGRNQVPLFEIRRSRRLSGWIDSRSIPIATPTPIPIRTPRVASRLVNYKKRAGDRGPPL